jgi:hypothetical protein
MLQLHSVLLHTVTMRAQKKKLLVDQFTIFNSLYKKKICDVVLHVRQFTI